MNSAQRIRLLNDAFRCIEGSRKDWHVFSDDPAVGSALTLRAVAAIINFDRFPAIPDPSDERDYGVLILDGHSLSWKIDYFDVALAKASPDPANAAVTRRVMTIILSSGG